MRRLWEVSYVLVSGEREREREREKQTISILYCISFLGNNVFLTKISTTQRFYVVCNEITSHVWNVCNFPTA